MNIKSWNILLVAVFLIVLTGGGYMLYQGQSVKLAQQHAARAQAEKDQRAAIAREEMERAEEIQAREAALKEKFEDFLNGFLQDVSENVREYGESRKVLSGLVDPINMRAPEYIEENYALSETVILRLQLQMDKIMGVFEQADKDFVVLLDQWPVSQKDIIEGAWQQTRDQQAGLYIAYFESEQELIKVIQDFLAFCNEKRDSVTYDEESGNLLFKTEAEQEQYVGYLNKMNEIKSVQSSLFTK
ncbi:MAG: hypothetical protein KDI46_07095 [Alphaproteobacteria bacterium]|nr:hypothetical protein [Alphaproteobacteria bacterium]